MMPKVLMLWGDLRDVDFEDESNWREVKELKDIDKCYQWIKSRMGDYAEGFRPKNTRMTIYQDYYKSSFPVYRIEAEGEWKKYKPIELEL